MNKSVFHSFFLFYFCFLLNGCSSTGLFRLHDMPKPNGLYTVGTRQFDWINKNHKDEFSLDSTKNRRIMVQFWYPGVLDKSNELLFYCDNQTIVDELSKEYNIPAKFLNQALNVKTNSYSNLQPLVDKAKYPLIIFSHGKGGYKSQNTVQFEELASHGYVVVSVDHSYDAVITVFSDGTIASYVSDDDKKVGDPVLADKITQKKLSARVSDVKFVLDKIWDDYSATSLYSIIDTSRVGMFGHSFGVATTVLSTQLDTRIDVSAGLDGWFVPLSDNQLNNGLKIPFLHIGRKSWGLFSDNYEKMEKLMNNSKEKQAHYSVKRMQHFDFMDGSQSASLAIKLVLPHMSTYNKDKIKNALNRMLLVYFNSNLKEDNSVTVDMVSRELKIIVD